MNTKTLILDEWFRAQAGKRCVAHGLTGIKGYLLLQVMAKSVATLHIDDGFLEITHDTDHAEAVAGFTDDETLVEWLCGNLNPVVALLQERMACTGDLCFATKAILGLRVGKPFNLTGLEQKDGDVR
jgi:hypothetical protein